MQTLETLHKRIRTAKDLRSIVRTMKSLSAVSIFQYETARAAIAQYQHTIELGLQIALRKRPPSNRSSVEAGTRAAILLFGSDHGLCGHFNDQIVSFALKSLRQECIEPSSCPWLVVGARAEARLAAHGATPSVCYFLPGSIEGLTDTVATLLVELDALQQEEAFDRAVMFYNQRHQRIVSVPQMRRLLPLDHLYLRALSRQPWDSRSLPTFTMDADRLFSALLQQYLFAMVYRAGAESMAAEHATRLSAMQTAERNIAEKLEEMNADYCRERQSAITAELLDIVSGYQAVSRSGG